MTSKAETKVEQLIRQIKEIPFDEALAIIRPDLELPEPPALICCPLHGEKTPSFGLRKTFFKCFGCQAGGDIIDFVVHDEEIEWGQALNYVQYKLGFIAQDVDSLIATAKGKKRKRYKDDSFELKIAVIEDKFTNTIKDYLQCKDPLVYFPAWMMAEYVYEEINQLRTFAPDTKRGKINALKTLEDFARGYAFLIRREALRMTGKDFRDVVSQPL